MEGREEPDPIVARCAGGIIDVPDALDLEHLGDAPERVRRVLAANEEVLLILEGAEGAGRRTLIAAAARALGRRAVAIDGARMSSEPAALIAEVRALRRECWLTDAVPVLARVDAVRRGDT